MSYNVEHMGHILKVLESHYGSEKTGSQALHTAAPTTQEHKVQQPNVQHLEPDTTLA